MRKIDRYIFGRLSYPFLSSLPGLLVFISLSLAIQLSDLLLGKGRAFWEVFYLLALKVPDFLVFALPVSLLFAVFTAFARLIDDGEVTAFQLGGYSLKRIVIPILVFGLLVSLAALAVNNYLVPWASLRYRESIYRIARGGVSARVRSDVFFEGPRGRTFYVGSYDPDSNLMENVLVFDKSGEHLGDRRGGNSDYPVLISCEKASFQDDRIQLRGGWLIRLDGKGQIRSTMQFEGFQISAGTEVKEMVSRGKRPDEMGVKKLMEEIKRARSGGLGADNLILALHSKFSLPFSALVFALFGGPISLIFLHRSKAVGILLSIAFAGSFQGLLLWGRTLVDRSGFSPVLAAWLPDILLGVAGLLLFLFLERMNGLRPARRIRGWFYRAVKRIRPRMILIVVFFLIGSFFTAHSNGLPLDLRARQIEVVGGTIKAEGEVEVSGENWKMEAGRLLLNSKKGEKNYDLVAEEEVKLSSDRFTIAGPRLKGLLKAGGEETGIDELRMKNGRGRVGNMSFSGEVLDLVQREGNPRVVKITGNASLDYGDSSTRGEKIRLEVKKESTEVLVEGAARSRQGEVKLGGKKMVFKLKESGEGIEGGKLRAESFGGEVPFTVEGGKERKLYYGGEDASFEFDSRNRLDLGSISRGWFSTCGCCGKIKGRPYAFGADSIKLYGENLVLARSVSLRGFGWPLGWFPFYFIPLDDVKRRPHFPEMGYSLAEGYFLKLEIPFSLDDKNFGTTIWDYYTKGPGLGFGFKFFSREPKRKTDLYSYFLKRSLRKNYYRVEAEGSWKEFPFIKLNYDLNYRRGPFEGKVYGRNEWELSLTPEGMEDFSVLFKREEEEKKYRGEDTDYVLERIPGLSSSIVKNLGPLKIVGRLNGGRIRESWPEISKLASGMKGGLELSSDLSFALGDLYEPTLSAGWGADSYFTELGSFRGGRSYYHLEPRLEIGGKNRLRLSYLHRRVTGNSPFYFDRKSAVDRIDANYSGGGEAWSQSAKLSYKFSPRRDRGFSPLNYGFSYDKGVYNLQLGLSYRLEKMALEKFKLTTLLEKEEAGLGISSVYDFRSGLFKDTSLEGRLGEEGDRLKFTVDLGSRLESIEDFSWKAKWTPLPEWKVKLEGTFDLPGGKFKGLEYSLTRQFQDCLEVGLKGDLDRLRFHVQILDFPSQEDERR